MKLDRRNFLKWFSLSTIALPFLRTAGFGTDDIIYGKSPMDLSDIQKEIVAMEAELGQQGGFLIPEEYREELLYLMENGGIASKSLEVVIDKNLSLQEVARLRGVV